MQRAVGGEGVRSGVQRTWVWRYVHVRTRTCVRMTMIVYSFLSLSLLPDYGHVTGHRTALGGVSPTINCTQSDETLEMCVTEKQCNSSMFPEIDCHEFPQTSESARN